MTVEAFWEQYANQPYELIDGEVVAVVPAGLSHGFITSRIAAKLRQFVDEHDLGEVTGAETGFRLSSDTLRAPDAAFISHAKLTTVVEAEKFATFAPDLAVEVVSPNDAASDIQQKVDSYLEAGTALVWVIYPDLRKVVVHHPDGTARSVPYEGTLDGGEVLPGLQLPVADLFPPQIAGEPEPPAAQGG